jgi:pantoate--beta-alanine ligase
MQTTARSWQRAGRAIGFVPTMGYLHAGHISLVRRARRAVGSNGVVVVSIYVNPTQFGPNEDFSRYPRDLRRDLRLCREAGVDVVFAPGSGQMYPAPGPEGFSTFIQEEQLSKFMEGVSRPSHFRGVTTVVGKLFNLVLPDVAVFGAKDYQQAAIITRMTRDLNFPVKIVVAPTMREPDGLAMSSRNKYLTGDLRPQALVLWRGIGRIRAAVRQGQALTADKARLMLEKLIESEPAARLDYVEFFNPRTLVPVTRVVKGTHMALAVYVGTTRLIDNARL